MVNVQLLKDKIKESGMTTVAICEKSGIVRQTLYSRFENPNFTLKEIEGLKKTLRLSSRDVNRIFHAQNVQ